MLHTKRLTALILAFLIVLPLCGCACQKPDVYPIQLIRPEITPELIGTPVPTETPVPAETGIPEETEAPEETPYASAEETASVSEPSAENTTTPPPKTNMFRRLLSAPQVDMIGKTFSEITERYGSLKLVFFFADSSIEYYFGDEKFAFYFDQIEVPDTWWNGNTPFTGIIPVETVMQTVRGRDICTGVYASFRMLGVDSFGNYSDCFDIGDREYSEMDDCWLYYREFDGCSFCCSCDYGRDRLNEDDYVSITKHDLPEAGSDRSGWVHFSDPFDSYAEGDWYYYLPSGKPATGWAEIDGRTFYFLSDGRMADGLRTIDGVEYFFRMHPYGGGPSDGYEPSHGWLCSGFNEMSDGSMVYSDSRGHVITYDGQNSGVNYESYFEYASQAFRLIYDADRLRFYDDVQSYGFFDIDGDCRAEFYVLYGWNSSDAIYVLYRADPDARCYAEIGHLDGTVGKLATDGRHLLYVSDRQPYLITIANGTIRSEALPEDTSYWFL